MKFLIALAATLAVTLGIAFGMSPSTGAQSEDEIHFSAWRPAIGYNEPAEETEPGYYNCYNSYGTVLPNPPESGGATCPAYWAGRAPECPFVVGYWIDAPEQASRPCNATPTPAPEPTPCPPGYYPFSGYPGDCALICYEGSPDPSCVTPAPQPVVFPDTGGRP